MIEPLKQLQADSLSALLNFQSANFETVFINEGFREIEEISLMNVIKAEEYSPIIITDHAYERAKERLSMNHVSFKKLSERAFEFGCRHSDSAGNLKKFIDGLYLKKKTANNIKIYGENVFLFDGKILITVYQVPNNLRKSALKIQKNRKAA